MFPFTVKLSLPLSGLWLVSLKYAINIGKICSAVTPSSASSLCRCSFWARDLNYNVYSGLGRQMKKMPLLIKWFSVTYATVRFCACFRTGALVCLSGKSRFLRSMKTTLQSELTTLRVEGSNEQPLSLWGWGAVPSQCGPATAGWNEHRILSFIYSLRATEFVWNCGRIMAITLQLCANPLVPALTVSFFFFFASGLATKGIKKDPPIFLMSARKSGQYFLQSEPAGEGICIACKSVFCFSSFSTTELVTENLNYCITRQ